ncbi:MAG: DUF86 domain-containing protein [Synechococcaceae cyanobacterium SM2_3_2]|nr:DUF86 domain-containing protein [Synechococcaceae cyanobacterium SM2_3_2]
MRDPKERLRDIISAIESIERYQDISYEDLENNDLVSVWFVRHLEIIREAARALPQAVKELDTSVQWSEIIGMRTILVHQYFMIDLEVLWEVVQNDVPILKIKVQNILSQLGEEIG